MNYMDLGPCCVCGTTDGVRNIVMIDRKSPIPGHGWGCLVCGLPQDGASYVTCDPCFEQKLEPNFACRGYPGIDGRIPFGELTGSHRHDMDRHAGEMYGGLPAIPGAGPWERV